MASKEAQQTFFELKTFPRSKNGAVDDGTKRRETPNSNCDLCGGQMLETVSLEWCSECLDIQTDYWHGLHLQ